MPPGAATFLLWLRGETKTEEEQKDHNYHYRELLYGAFTRTLRLPTGVKAMDAKAVYKDGVLEVKIPKAAPVKTIPVNPGRGLTTAHPRVRASACHSPTIP
jgi:HSP20 family molecular chaperone IbpA